MKVIEEQSVKEYIKETLNGEARLTDTCMRLLQLSDPTVIPNRTDFAVDWTLEIYNYFLQKYHSPLRIKDEFNKLFQQSKKALFPEKELNWIKANDRACYYTWARLTLSTIAVGCRPVIYDLTGPHVSSFTPEPEYYGSTPSNLFNYPQIKTALTYTDLGLPPNPSSAEQRYQAVLKYFDRSPEPLEWKLGLLSILRGDWGEIFRAKRKPLRWLKPDNKEQCIWAWEYLTKLSPDKWQPNISVFQPTSERELYFAICAAYDLWKAAPEYKSFFSSNFKNAWNQKCHRDNRQDKSYCNLLLDNSVKLKLKELSKARGEKLSEVIETLINREYEDSRL